MNVRSKVLAVFSIIMILSMVLAACGTTTVVETKEVIKEVTKEIPGKETIKEVTKEVPKETVKEVTKIVQVTVAPPTPVPSTRKGAWVDTVVFTEQNSAQAAIKQLQAGDIDVYAYSVADAGVFKELKADPNLGYTNAFGSYNEITFNPAGPVFEGSKKLNPFSVPAVREAMNMLIDRNYVVQEIYSGLAIPKFTNLNANFPDYARYVDVSRKIEAQYAYNLDKAKEIVTKEMQTLGATLVGDKWNFNNEPVVLIAIIRVEDQRRQIGDYFCSQLEKIGFTVDRQYKTRTEASPIWNQSNPNDGKMHFYTGGWITTAVSRDDATNFGYFYTPLGSGSPLWQGYKPSEEYYSISKKLWVNDFKSMDERKQLFSRALELSMQDSVRVWVVDQLSFGPQKANVTVAYDLAGGVSGGSLWPYTIRFKDQDGGVMKIAQPGILVEPWNPLAGSNWIYDQMPGRATMDYGTLSDPYTGLVWPQRIDKAEVTVKEGLPVGKTLDWFTLKTAASIEVPKDAWADWNAKDQKFITVGEKFTSTVTANVKSVVTYPADLFKTVKWHDGSTLSIGDFVMGMILTFDRGKADSPNFDESAVPALDAFMSAFKGFKIASTEPLVIEYYTDQIYLDAEYSVYTMWPNYGFGPGAWHNLAIGLMADAEKDVKKALAFSTDKASKRKGVEWMSYIAGPSLAILKADLDKATTDNYLPYAATLGAYVKPEEIALRYKNLTQFFKIQGHFWIGTGPFYLNKAFTTEKTLTINRFDGFVDPASKWARFGTPMIATAELDGPSQVTIGKEAKFDVLVTFEGKPYKNADLAEVKFLLFNAKGVLVTTGAATPVEDGKFSITLSADITKQLEAGSNKLEVAIASKLVSIPAFAPFEFVTAP